MQITPPPTPTPIANPQTGEIADEMVHQPKRRKKSSPLAVIALCLLFLLSCNKGEVYYKFHHIPADKWSKDSTLTFRLDSLPFLPYKSYDVFIELYTNHRYPYRNIWFYIDQNLTDTVMQRDSLQFLLTDEAGKPKGNGVGGLCFVSVPYRLSLKLDSTRMYTIRLSSAMRNAQLEGVEKAGVRVQEK